MKYKKNTSITMIEDGKYKGIISNVRVDDSKGEDNTKLIIDITLEDERVFTAFLRPFLSAFDDCITIAGEKPSNEGEFDERNLMNEVVEFETKITTAKSGTDYCNIQWIKKADLGWDGKKN